MNKKRIIAIIIGLLIIITAMVVLIVSKNKAPDNPPETVGNTPSNLYNGGTFCQYGDLVFFANSNDGDALYLMNKDESGAKKLNSSSVLSINADKDRVYYSLSGKSSGTGLGLAIARQLAGDNGLELSWDTENKSFVLALNDEAISDRKISDDVPKN